MTPIDEQQTFYTEVVPAQFNRTHSAQREAAQNDPEAARVLEEMEAVRTSIVVQVDAGDALHRYGFDIDRGRMRHVETPAHPPFLILGHALEDIEDLRRECGNSLLGFLGGLAGLGDEMRLTAQRVRSLRELEGSLVFERVGSSGFALFAHFGVAAPSAEPKATIRLDEDTYARLRNGSLDPQDAFLSGQIEVSGDEGMAIGLALAALSPE